MACLAGGSQRWPLFPQPFGKLECCSSAKEIPSLGEYILCTLQLHPSSLKTFQATYLNSSHMVTHRCPSLCSCLSAASSLPTPARQQQNNLWMAGASCAFKTRLDVFNILPHFPMCRLLSNISGKAAGDSSQFLWHFKAPHMFNISTTSFPRASCFSCHSSFHTVCIVYELSTASLP